MVRLPLEELRRKIPDEDRNTENPLDTTHRAIDEHCRFGGCGASDTRINPGAPGLLCRILAPPGGLEPPTRGLIPARRDCSAEY